MKCIAKRLPVSIVVATFAAASVVPVAHAEIAATAGVASMYLWRGQDLGDGSPAVFGDLTYSTGGFYTGIWGSSGDNAWGSEYDLFAGYGFNLGEVEFDLSVWNYNYSDLGESNATFGDMTDVILTVGFGGFTFGYYDTVANDGDFTPGSELASPYRGEGYEYYSLAYAFDKFTAKVGYADPEEKDLAGFQAAGFASEFDGDYVHVDLGYAYNDNLSFTLSQIVDSDEEAGYDDDLMFVVTYALPVL